MAIFIGISVVILSIILFLFLNKKENIEEQPSLKEDSSLEVQESPTDEISVQEEKVSAIEESFEAMEERLKALSNPDQDKPFAKISKPTISETPSTMLDDLVGKIKEEVLETPETPETELKPKRKYKKRNKNEDTEKQSGRTEKSK